MASTSRSGSHAASSFPRFARARQAQFVEQPIDSEAGLPLDGLLDWARSRLGDGVTIDDLARRAAVSRRTLSRRFRSAVGLSPGAWLQRERVLLAQRLLETRDEPLTAIARRAGYATATTMRAQFASGLGISPRAYRQSFRG